MRESELLAHIYDRSSDLPTSFTDILVGPGDDCAVVQTPAGDTLLITTDQLIEHRHYTPETPIDLIARKAIARSLSDIAAMGGTPVWALATAAVPANYPHPDQLFDALSRWARHWRCPLIGGDIATTPGPAVLTVTAIGRPHRHDNRESPPVLRSAAREGDNIYITGQIGASLETEHHLTFEPRLGLAREIMDRCHDTIGAMIDISDGLGRDAARIAKASNTVLEIEAARVRLRAPATDWRTALAAGEDYELLFTLRPGATPPVACTHIGRVRLATNDPPACIVIDADNKPHRADDMGWDHASPSDEPRS